jgi:transcriptional regulator with XRE-family HTH domain
MTGKTRNDKKMLKPLGERIRDLRDKKGWSQEAMAKAAAMNAGHLDEIERGEIDSSLETLVRIATAFNITLSELVHGIV